MTIEAIPADKRYAAFRHSAFLRFWTARFLTTFAAQVMSVAVGWQIYDLTRDPFDLGLVGIIQFTPSLLLVLVTGAVADRFGRRLIMALASFLEALCALALLALTLRGLTGPAPIFAVLVLLGIARAFFGPASSSLVANLVPPEDFANAVAAAQALLSDPPALQSLIVTHLRAIWDGGLADEWRRTVDLARRILYYHRASGTSRACEETHDVPDQSN